MLNHLAVCQILTLRQADFHRSEVGGGLEMDTSTLPAGVDADSTVVGSV